MTSEQTRHLPGWLWGILGTGLVVLVGLLLAKDRVKEPGPAYVLDMEPFKEVDPALVKFREAERIACDIPHLSAMAVAPDGALYVCGENAVARFGAEGKEEGRFSVEGRPDCMAVAPDGEILLGMRTRIEPHGPDGAQRPVWKNAGEQAYFTSITVNDTDVYVADAGNRIVLRYDRQGNLQNRIGGEDAARDIAGFIVPSPYFDLAFDPSGSLWAVNPGRHGLEAYRPNGDLISSWYRPSMEAEGFCGCCNPIHIAFRPDGLLVTMEKGVSRVKVYAPDQTLVGLVSGSDSFEKSAEAAACCTLETPLRDLAVDPAGRVLVLDCQAGAVIVFEEKEPLS